jgi:hypothetical protein
MAAQPNMAAAAYTNSVGKLGIGGGDTYAFDITTATAELLNTACLVRQEFGGG